MKPDGIPNLVIVSDLHCGCQVGLLPPEGFVLDNGPCVKQSRLQKVVWSWWREFWDEWVPTVCRHEPFSVCINGDSLDGVHHNSTTQITHNLEDQAKIALSVLSPIRAKAKKFYMIRGTEAHVGPSGAQEESLARSLGSEPDKEGHFARFELWKRVGDKEGPLCHITHHIGSSGRAAYESSGPQAELVAEYTEAAQQRKDPPDFVIRSHRHRFIKVINPSLRHEAASVVTPAWQMKTPFTFKIPGGRVSQPQFGGIVVRQGDEEFYTRHYVKSLERPEVE